MRLQSKGKCLQSIIATRSTFFAGPTAHHDEIYALNIVGLEKGLQAFGTETSCCPKTSVVDCQQRD